MTDEQKAFLAGRLEEASKAQPDLKSFRLSLLAFGGLEFVPPGKPDPDLSELLSSGRLITEPIVMEQLDEGHCHENVAELWLSRERGLTAIGTGYALSEDGLWRQHSWGMRDDQIVETTSERLKYFGRLLTEGEADAFANTNLGNPEERHWRRLPEIWFRLEKDADGYPPKEWEGLKSEPRGAPGIYRLKCAPFFARDVAYDDEVIAEKAEDGDYLIFKAVSKRSGYSTIRLWIPETESATEVMDSLIERHCLVESASNFGHRLIAASVPPGTFENVDSFISAQREIRHWGVQDGYIANS